MEDKVIKNHFASEYIYNRYKNDKSCGIIEGMNLTNLKSKIIIIDDKVNGIIKVAEPIGPIAGIVPVTNPTSTIIFKVLLSLKTRNAISIYSITTTNPYSVFSSSPSSNRFCLLR